MAKLQSQHNNLRTKILLRELFLTCVANIHHYSSEQDKCSQPRRGRGWKEIGRICTFAKLLLKFKKPLIYSSKSEKRIKESKTYLILLKNSVKSRKRTTQKLHITDEISSEKDYLLKLSRGCGRVTVLSCNREREQMVANFRSQIELVLC